MSADVSVHPLAALLGHGNGVGATCKAKELRKREGGTGTVSPSLLTQTAEPSVLRLAMGALLVCWARTAVVLERDQIGSTGAATLKTRLSCLAKLGPKRGLTFPSPQ